MQSDSTTMLHAIQLALAGEWDQAHNIVQDFDDPIACWIHAVLHKIEGDAWNSRYWYRRTDYDYAQFADSQQELKYIASCLKPE